MQTLMESGKTQKPLKTLELKKHVATIHSCNHLTLVQRKIANALLYNAYDQLLTRDEHEIHVRVLCELIGYDSRDHKKIKQALIKLISTVIEWNLVDKDRLPESNTWNASAIIADASIKGPICRYSYSNRMRQLLYRPELYGRLNMQVQARFKSTYGLALYENCIRYQNIAHTPWIDMPTFRKLMGVEESKYPIYRDFKRRVLDKAVAEVNTHSPIQVSVKIKKQAGQVNSVQFQIAQSIQSAQSALHNPLEPTKTPARTIAAQLNQDFGLSTLQIQRILVAFEETYILEKIALVEASPSYQQGKIVNLAKYLTKALEDDYQPTQSSQQKMAVLRRTAAKDRQTKNKNDEEQVRQYRAWINQKILMMVQQLNEPLRADILQEFGRYISDTVYYNVYLKDGLMNPLVIDRFRDFIRCNRPQWISSLPSIEDYCQNNRAIEIEQCND